MIENSALRPQLYHQVRSWIVNEIAFYHCKIFIYIYIKIPQWQFLVVPSSLPITLVFLLFVLENHKSSVLINCCNIASMALLNVLVIEYWVYSFEQHFLFQNIWQIAVFCRLTQQIHNNANKLPTFVVAWIYTIYFVWFGLFIYFSFEGPSSFWFNANAKSMPAVFTLSFLAAFHFRNEFTNCGRFLDSHFFALGS